MEVKIVSQNEVGKTFEIKSEVSGDVTMFVNKAFDEDSDAHFLVVSIRELPLLNVANIQYPIKFDTEEGRNYAFDNEVNESWASFFLTQIENNIIESRSSLKQENETNNN
jgi:hypothetical protein